MLDAISTPKCMKHYAKVETPKIHVLKIITMRGTW